MQGHAQVREAIEPNVKAVSMRPGVAKGTATTRAVLRAGLECTVTEGPYQLTVGMGGPAARAYSRFDERMREEAHGEYLASIAPFARGEAYALPGESVVARGVTRRDRGPV